jgi:hypothetical protein
LVYLCDGLLTNLELTNIERLDLAKRLGFNLVHPVPPGEGYALEGDHSAFDAYLDHAEKLGLWIIYDMRHCESTS